MTALYLKAKSNKGREFVGDLSKKGFRVLTVANQFYAIDKTGHVVPFASMPNIKRPMDIYRVFPDLNGFQPPIPVTTKRHSIKGDVGGSASLLGSSADNKPDELVVVFDEVEMWQIDADYDWRIAAATDENAALAIRREKQNAIANAVAQKQANSDLAKALKRAYAQYKYEEYETIRNVLHIQERRRQLDKEV